MREYPGCRRSAREERCDMMKRILPIIVSLAACIACAPALALAAEANGSDAAETGTSLVAAPLYAQGLNAQSAAANDPTPKNVQVKLLRTETDASGQKWLVTEVSWDGNSNVNYNELYPFLADKAGDLYVIPHAKGQTIVRKGTEANVPADREYTEKNGRNNIILKVPVLDKDAKQIETDAGGTKANGLKEGDTAVFLLTSIVPVNGQWYETNYSKGFEVVFTEQNVKQQAAFTQNGVEKCSLPAMKIAKLESGKKTITVNWKKLSKSKAKRIKKVEIQYSTDKNFSKNVKTKRVSSKKIAATLKKLKSGKKYYVRIRAYTKSGTTVNVSKWSVKKSAKAQ